MDLPSASSVCLNIFIKYMFNFYEGMGFLSGGKISDSFGGFTQCITMRVDPKNHGTGSLVYYLDFPFAGFCRNLTSAENKNWLRSTRVFKRDLFQDKGPINS